MDKIDEIIRREVRVIWHNAKERGEDAVLALLHLCQKLMEYSKAREQMGLRELGGEFCRDKDIKQLVSVIVSFSESERDEAILFMFAVSEISSLVLLAVDPETPLQD